MFKAEDFSFIKMAADIIFGAIGLAAFITEKEEHPGGQ